FILGDSSLSQAPNEGGSFTAASVGSAVRAACIKVRQRLLTLARKVDGSPLANAALKEVIFADGTICLRTDPTRGISFLEVMTRSKRGGIKVEGSPGARRR